MIDLPTSGSLWELSVVPASLVTFCLATPEERQPEPQRQVRFTLAHRAQSGFSLLQRLKTLLTSMLSVSPINLLLKWISSTFTY